MESSRISSINSSFHTPDEPSRAEPSGPAPRGEAPPQPARSAAVEGRRSANESQRARSRFDLPAISAQDKMAYMRLPTEFELVPALVHQDGTQKPQREGGGEPYQTAIVRQPDGSEPKVYGFKTAEGHFIVADPTSHELVARMKAEGVGGELRAVHVGEAGLKGGTDYRRQSDGRPCDSQGNVFRTRDGRPCYSDGRVWTPPGSSSMAGPSNGGYPPSSSNSGYPSSSYSAPVNPSPYGAPANSNPYGSAAAPTSYSAPYYPPAPSAPAYPPARPAQDTSYRTGQGPVDQSSSGTSSWSMGPQRGLSGLGDMADCGQYAAGSTSFSVRSVHPSNGTAGAYGASTRPADMEATHGLSAGGFSAAQVPREANRVAYQNLATGSFHYGRIHRDRHGRVSHLTQTDANRHSQAGQGGTYRTFSTRRGSLSLTAQRGVQPSEQLNSHRSFVRYCEETYGPGNGIYFFAQ